MLNLIETLSAGHTKYLILCFQESWKYKIPPNFCKKVKHQYEIIHEPAMDSTKPKGPGRPYGGIGMIISIGLSFKPHYQHSRCLSVVLHDFNIIINNVYLPYNNRHTSAEQNEANYLEALGHLIVSHDTAGDTTDFITIGDVNVAPNDNTNREDSLNDILENLSYESTDLHYLPSRAFTHKSERLIDRIFTTSHMFNCCKSVYINNSFWSSDHFPICAQFSFQNCSQPQEKQRKKSALNWKRASERAILSYCRLSDKQCLKTLKKFRQGQIDAVQLYTDTVENLTSSAEICIPKFKPAEKRNRHIPQW